MAIEYGYRDVFDNDNWGWSREYCEQKARAEGCLLIAREVSEPRIVSIRA